VVNATGLGARALAGDRAVTGLAGQVLVTGLGEVDPAVSICDDRREDAMFYAIPRRGSLVLGGCAIPCAGDDPPAEDAALTARILADAARLGLRHGPILAIRRGLRPVRPEVRLERAGRVVHCYGHGGAGYTLALGCAEDVNALV
jgi:D-amino-acid oxidase